jgi:spoIIIJ-associated protein
MTTLLSNPDEAASKVTKFLELLIASAHLELTPHLTTPGADQQSVAEPASALSTRAPLLTVDFTGPDTPLLLARSGELLHAIEHIAAKILGLESDDHDRVSFDAEGFKANRDRELFRSAEIAIEEVRSTGLPFAFPPMTSRERRMLHMALTKSGLPTASSGENPRRFVVLYPGGQQPPKPDSNTADRTQAIRARFRRR